MSNEAVIVELLGEPKGCPVRFTCPSDTSISKGTILKLSDARVVAVGTTPTDTFAGIAAHDKDGSDSSTEITAYTKGIFDLYTDATITAGMFVGMSGSNLVNQATDASISGGCLIGKALETSAAGTPETINVAVGIY